ncbi:MAG: outer membrane protein transport protein [Gammaproteobacteria bacterium]|nr:outer membrane protein transport protein [Gammaproteobacteria bacterium]
MKRQLNITSSGLILICSSALPLSAQAAGFAIIENGVSGLGNAYAGGSAVAEDASTVYFNPAGMSRLQKHQITAAGHIIQPEMTFTNNGSNVAGVVPISGGNGGDAGEDAFVPNFFYTNNINSKLDFGFGVNAPFGNSTNYQEGWVGRYHALKSEIVTINLNPAISYKMSDQLSFGFGLNYQTAEVTLSSNIDQPALCTGLAGSGIPGFGVFAACAGTPTTNDGTAVISGDGSAWGFNFGMMYQINDAGRLGFAYRSAIKHELTGTADFTDIHPVLLAGGLYGDSAAAATAELPASWSLSYHHKLNDSWEIMADYTVTEWSSLPELRISFPSVNTPDSVEELEWEDASRISVGGTYRMNDKMKLRFGYAMDESPVPSAERASPRVPDADRTWLTVGLGYTISKETSVDVGYAMISVDDVEINRTNGTNATLRGSYESEVSILSAQLNWNF